MARRGEQALRFRDLPPLDFEHSERTQGREVGTALRGGPAQREGLGVAPHCLEDRRPLRVKRGPARATSPRGVEVGERLGETVEGGTRPGPGQLSRAVIRRVAHQCLSQVRGSFVVGDSAKHLPANEEQVDQGGRAGHGEERCSFLRGSCPV
jgi:hypothetical protein